MPSLNILPLVFILIAFLKLSSSSESAGSPSVSKCHPMLDSSKTHYVIGYGSLINEESKSKTYPNTGINIPVNIDGFKRTWTARGTSNVSLSTTYLGIDIDPSASLNGIIYSVPSYEAVVSYDVRERFYCRVQVPYEQVSIFRGNVSDNNTFPTENDLKNANFWIYVTSPAHRHFPDDRYPIVQSYVDTFLSGCIKMEKKYGLEDYAKKCITETEGWNNPWVNDRLQPRRPWAYQKDSTSIDQLIAKYIPGHSTYQEKVYVGRSVDNPELINSGQNDLKAFTGVMLPLLVLTGIGC